MVVAKRRNPLIDNLKAWGIFLVVLGHALPSSTPYLIHLIYSFHMPLFFFLSGYLLKPDLIKLPRLAFLRYQAQRLLVPYAVFGILLYVAWVLVFRKFETIAPVEWYRPLLGMFYGVNENGYLNHAPALWFLPCLFVAMWMAREAIASRYPWLIAGLGAAIAYNLSLYGVRLPWSADSALLALPFVLGGYYWRQKSPNINPVAIHLGGIVALPLWLLAVKLNGMVDMNTMNLGAGGPICFYTIAMLGIAFSAYIFKNLPATRIAGYMALHTLWIFPLHEACFMVTKGVGLFVLHMPIVAWQTLGMACLLTVIGLAAPLAARQVYDRLLGFARS